MSIAIRTQLLFLLIFLGSTLPASASLTPANTGHDSSLSFRVDTQSAYDETLISRLEKFSVFDRLRTFSEQDLHLKQKVVYQFHQTQTAEQRPNPETKTVTEQASAQPSQASAQDIIIDIPFSFLYQLDQGLISKYPQQADIHEAIYSATIEKFLWFELGRALITQFELGISGQEVFALDNFSTLMLLNLNHQGSDYILDATEAFLLIRQSIPYSGKDDYGAEVSLDEQRYRKAVCLILGKDYLAHLSKTEQPYHQLLAELAWDQKKIEQCQKLYLEKLQTWFKALQPHLREENRLSGWLAAH